MAENAEIVAIVSKVREVINTSECCFECGSELEEGAFFALVRDGQRLKPALVCPGCAADAETSF